MINNKNKFIFFGVLVALILWFVDVVFHVVVLKSGGFYKQLFPLHDSNELWMRVIVVSVVLFVGSFSQYMANKITKEYEKERELTKKLANSLKEIKLLRGILPICASCKKIRDDQGFWSQVEAYISEHSEIKFSHSICPECLKKLYPDYYYRKFLKKNQMAQQANASNAKSQDI